MLALAGGNVIVVLSVPASVSVLLTVSVLDVVPPAMEKPVARAVRVRPLTLVGVIAPRAAQVAVVPLEVRKYPFVPIARRVELFVPLPIMRSPVVVTGDSALKPAAAVVWPVPPYKIAIGTAFQVEPDPPLPIVPAQVRVLVDQLALDGASV